MRKDVIITCAVTGSADTASKHPDLPITPKQIAQACIEAAKAGAAVVHCHVRDPQTGAPARDVALFRELVDRIRSSDTDVVINLSAGMGGDLVIGPGENPLDFNRNETDMIGPLARLAHVEECLPEICTLDCATMNFGDTDYVMVNSPVMLRAMAKRIQELGVKPEIEVFDTGNLWHAKQLCDLGLIDGPPLFQVCLGIPWGAPADTAHMKTFADAMPDGAIWAGFGISRSEMPMVAQAILLGGNVRVGLEDNLYLEKGVFATNAELVERARKIIELMGSNIMTPQETRDLLGLKKRG